MNLGKNIDGLINGGGTFLSPPEILARNGGSGGGGCDCDLPKPTPQDAGKVVSINEQGEFIFTTPTASESHYIVHVTWNNGTAQLDKTYSEIEQAIEDGLIPIFMGMGDNYIESYIFMGMGISVGNEFNVTLGSYDYANTQFVVFTFNSLTSDETLIYSGGIVI